MYKKQKLDHCEKYRVLMIGGLGVGFGVNTIPLLVTTIWVDGVVFLHENESLLEHVILWKQATT